MTIQPWTILRSQLVLDHRWSRVRQDHVQLPTGLIVEDYFVHERPDVAMVLPITRDRHIVMVQQYRHGVQQILLELPAGTVDATETPVMAAQRELREETGYQGDRLIPLGTLYDNPVKDTNRIHLFLALDVEWVSPQQLDATEAIAVQLVPLDQIPTRIQQGEISVAGTIAALWLGLQRLTALTLDPQIEAG